MSIYLTITGLSAAIRNMYLPNYRQLNSRIQGRRESSKNANLIGEPVRGISGI